MANVTFSINAIDKTRAAFAQVDRGLKNLINGGDATQKKLLAMGLRAAGVGSILAVMAGQIRKVATETENVPGIDRATIDSWERLKMTTETTGGVLQNMTATVGRGVSDLVGLIRFGAIAAFKGLDAAQKDLLATDALAAARRRENSGEIDREIESMRKLGAARKEYNLVRMRETEGESIMRRRDEAAALEQQAAAADSLAKKNELLASAVKLRTDAERDLVKLEDTANDAQAQRIAGEDEISRVWQTSTKSLRELNAEREKAMRLLGDNNMAMLGGDLTAMEKAASLNKEIVAIDKQRLGIMNQQKALAQQIGATMASSIEEAIISGGKFKDLLRGIAQDIARILIRNMITTPLANAISGGLSGMFGGGKAIGGPVNAGTTYLVGERGPEFFTPSTAGRIIPNHDIAAASGSGGGDTFNFVYNIAAGVSHAELGPALEQNRRATIATWQSMRARSPRPYAFA